MNAPILYSTGNSAPDLVIKDDQPQSQLIQKSGQEVAKQKSAKLGKTDSRYWLSRLFRNFFTRDGVRCETADWCARISRKGNRETFNLETPNREAAAKKAQAIYLFLVANGWDATLAKFKPKAQSKQGAAAISTIGEFLTEVEATSGLFAATFKIYAQALRFIAASIEQIGDQPAVGPDGKPLTDRNGKPILASRFDHKTGGRDLWVAKVSTVSLAVLSPDQIQRWKLSYLKKAGAEPDIQRRASSSVNAHLRNARSLFSENTLKHAKANLCLPDPLPFTDTKLEKRGNTRYNSKIDAKLLLEDAMKELSEAPTPEEDPPPGKPRKRRKPGGQRFKIFCLGLLCGLRKREIDSLLWVQVDFENAQIRIEATKYFRPKSEDSIAVVDLDPELLALLRKWKKKAKGEFVLESPNPPRYHVSRTNYRCESEFVALYDWLKSKGITALKKLHELRKELGAILASNSGIFAAQQVLRHADIRTTQQYYVDKKRRITAGLGSHLAMRQSNPSVPSASE